MPSAAAGGHRYAQSDGGSARGAYVSRVVVVLHGRFIFEIEVGPFKTKTAHLHWPGRGQWRDAETFCDDNEELVSLTDEQQLDLLALVVPHYERIVNRNVHIALKPHEFDALVSFVYNPGGKFTPVAQRHLLTSPLMRKLLPTLSMHRCQHICRWLAMMLAAVGVWSLPMPAQSAQLLQGYAGQWQVRRVLLNDERMDRLLYQVDDPRLVGRTVSIEPLHIESDLPEASTCTQPVLEPHLQPLNVLLTDTLVSTRPGQDLARAFGLSLPGTQEVKVAWTACTTGRFGPSLKGMPASRQTKSGRTWVALAAPNQLLLRWYGDTVLVLEPVPSEQQPRPSFACDRARLPAEHAICASPRLMSYDLSVSTAWGLAIQACEGEPRCLNDLRRTQKRWLVTRNHCGHDEDCLRQVMKSRLDVLMASAVH